MKKMTRSILPALLVMFFAVGEAHGAVLATATRQNLPTTVTTTATFLRLDDAGATSLAFSTATTQTVVITYNGDCSVGPDGNVLGVIIYVDGVAANGTAGSSYSRMCASPPYETHSRTVFITVGPGVHTVQVAGVLFTSGFGGFLRTVLTVMN